MKKWRWGRMLAIVATGGVLLQTTGGCSDLLAPLVETAITLAIQFLLGGLFGGI